jgi:Fe-S-cluster-containing hydrogenase component 2
VCPSGALRRFEEPGFQGLEFDAAACVSCGVCVIVCPEQALRLEPRHPDLPDPAPEHITRHALTVCSRCDAEFTASAGNEFCPACRKNVGLFTHGFSARSNES